MRFSEARSWTASPAEVFQARCSRSAREEACKASGSLSWIVEVTGADPDGLAQLARGQTVRVQIDRVMPPDVPAMVRSLVGDSIGVHQVEVWSRVGDAFHADVVVSIVGQPARMTGASQIAGDDAQTVEQITGEVKVNVPFIGGRIEPEIAKVLLAALRLEQDAAEKWLTSRG